MTYCEDQVTQT